MGEKARPKLPNHWPLQTAKARFSELIRCVKSDGPQHVTIHGRDEAVILSADEFRRLQGKQTGRDLVDVMQTLPYQDLNLEPARGGRPEMSLIFLRQEQSYSIPGNNIAEQESLARFAKPTSCWYFQNTPCKMKTVSREISANSTPASSCGFAN